MLQHVREGCISVTSVIWLISHSAQRYSYQEDSEHAMVTQSTKGKLWHNFHWFKSNYRRTQTVSGELSQWSKIKASVQTEAVPNY
jgi:hypothetical protein